MLLRSGRAIFEAPIFYAANPSDRGQLSGASYLDLMFSIPTFSQRSTMSCFLLISGSKLKTKQRYDWVTGSRIIDTF